VSTKPVMGTTATGRPRNRSWPEALKREIVAASFSPGSSVSIVARQYDVNANQVFSWRKRYCDDPGPAADGSPKCSIASRERAARPSDVKKGVACRHRRDCCPRKGGVLMAGVYSSRICSQAANASQNTRSSEVPFSIAIMAR
jgi:transposase-like protein